jgi:site-specific recombinase XerD
MYLTKSNRSPYYQIVYFVDRKRCSISTKKKLKSEALKFLQEYQDTVDKPILVENLLLSEFQEKYLNYVDGLRSTSYIKSIRLSFKMLCTQLGDIPLKIINQQMIEGFLSLIYKRAPSAAGLYYRTLKAAFRKAKEWNNIYDNPFDKVKLPKIPQRLPSIININEFELILSNTKSELLKNIFIIALFTGMRLGELVNMRWSWIDLEQRIITVKNSDIFITKGKKERLIPIHLNVMNILFALSKIERCRNENDFVFKKLNNVKLNEDFVSKQFKISVRAAKLNDDIHFHTLRHSFASILVQRGVSLYVVKELLGHEDIKTTQVYSHLTQVSLLNAVNML